MAKSFRENRFRAVSQSWVTEDRNSRRLGNVFLEALFGMMLRKLFEKARVCTPWNLLRKGQNHQLLSRRSLHRSPGIADNPADQRKHMHTMPREQCIMYKFSIINIIVLTIISALDCSYTCELWIFIKFL